MAIFNGEGVCAQLERRQTCHGEPMSADANQKIATAAALLAIAEKELHLALEQLHVFERADKQMVSLVVQAAFDKLAAARRSLDEAQALNKKNA